MAKRQHAFVRIAVLVAVALAVLVLDQVSKAFMRSYLADGLGSLSRGFLVFVLRKTQALLSVWAKDHNGSLLALRYWYV